jgi:hypothetical protein
MLQIAARSRDDGVDHEAMDHHSAQRRCESTSKGLSIAIRFEGVISPAARAEAQLSHYSCRIRKSEIIQASKMATRDWAGIAAGVTMQTRFLYKWSETALRHSDAK